MKSSESFFTVVGGDAMLGRALFNFLNRNKKNVVKTSRRKDLEKERVYLDFSEESSWKNLLGCTDACIVGGVTDYWECKNNPEAKFINENCIPKLALFLCRNEIRVTFVSSNTVFGGEKPWPNEYDDHNPGLDYGKQKSNAEKKLLSMAEEDGVTDLIKIVRFSKILDVDTSPIPSWIQSWSRAEQTKAFKDLIFAPITLDYAVSYLSLILESKEPGYYHVSGSEDVDYVTFAKFLAKSLDYPSNLVSETTSLEAGIEIPFLPKFSGLGMTDTIKTFGIKGQNLDNVVKSLSFKLTKL